MAILNAQSILQNIFDEKTHYLTWCLKVNSTKNKMHLVTLVNCFFGISLSELGIVMIRKQRFQIKDHFTDE